MLCPILNPIKPGAGNESVMGAGTRLRPAIVLKKAKGYPGPILIDRTGVMHMRATRYLLGVAIGLLMAFVLQAGHLERPENRVSADPLGPQVLDPLQQGIGKRIADRRLEHLYGGYASLHAIRGNRGTVVLVRDPECPVSRACGPRQADMAREYQALGFNFVVLYLNDRLDALSLARDAAGFDGPAVFAKGDIGKLAVDLGVNSTGDVFVLDAQQRLRYRGAVAACVLAESPKFPSTVMPFILRGVTLYGIDSVMAPLEPRERAWSRLARDLDAETLEAVASDISLADAVGVAADVLAGKVKGRLVVDVNS